MATMVNESLLLVQKPWWVVVYTGGHGLRDAGIHRQLCHATANPDLHKVYAIAAGSEEARVPLLADSINDWYTEFNDQGATQYFRRRVN